jgi:hypothetical protein
MRNHRTLALIALSSALFLAAPAVYAQPSAAARQEAGRHFRSGVESYQRGDYSTALAEFQSAYRIAPHHSVRVNIANCFMHLGRPIDALNHFESFVSEAATAGGIPAQQRREVAGQLAELRGQVGEVQVRVEPASVRDPIISVDGQTATATGVVRMMPGRHSVEVTADGYAAGRQEITVSAGQRMEVAITLRPPSAVTATTTIATTGPGVGTTTTAGTTTASTNTATNTTVTAGVTANSQPVNTAGTTGAETTATSTGPAVGATIGGSSTTPPPGNEVVAPPVDTRRGLPPAAFIGAAAGTGALAIGWGVFGGLALAANGDFNTIASRSPVDVQAGTAAANRARTFAAVSDVMMGLTVAGAVTTTILLFNTRWGAAPRSVAVLPMLSPSGASLSIGGSL